MSRRTLTSVLCLALASLALAGCEETTDCEKVDATEELFSRSLSGPTALSFGGDEVLSMGPTARARNEGFRRVRVDVDVAGEVTLLWRPADACRLDDPGCPRINQSLVDAAAVGDVLPDGSVVLDRAADGTLYERLPESLGRGTLVFWPSNGWESVVLDGTVDGRVVTPGRDPFSGSSCTGAFAFTSFAAGCGDGRRSADEACDDENLVDGDGCSAQCQLEDPFCDGPDQLVDWSCPEVGACARLACWESAAGCRAAYSPVGLVTDFAGRFTTAESLRVTVDGEVCADAAAGLVDASGGCALPSDACASATVDVETGGAVEASLVEYGLDAVCDGLPCLAWGTRAASFEVTSERPDTAAISGTASGIAMVAADLAPGGQLALVSTTATGVVATSWGPDLGVAEQSMVLDVVGADHTRLSAAIVEGAAAPTDVAWGGGLVYVVGGTTVQGTILDFGRGVVEQLIAGEGFVVAYGPDAVARWSAPIGALDQPSFGSFRVATGPGVVVVAGVASTPSSNGAEGRIVTTFFAADTGARIGQTSTLSLPGMRLGGLAVHPDGSASIAYESTGSSAPRRRTVEHLNSVGRLWSWTDEGYAATGGVGIEIALAEAGGLIVSVVDTGDGGRPVSRIVELDGNGAELGASLGGTGVSTPTRTAESGRVLFGAVSANRFYETEPGTTTTERLDRAVITRLDEVGEPLWTEWLAESASAPLAVRVHDGGIDAVYATSEGVRWIALDP